MDDPLSVGIVVKDPLISQDIAGIFGFWQAGSICRIYETVAEARAVPATSFDPELVFVAAQGGVLELSPADFDWLEARNVITLDLRETGQFSHWQHLSRPFAEAQVIQAAYELLRLNAGDRAQTG
ncbi:hypothetical protein [uncultured Roseobacter sp.]|uniref:hypothetical protein n=1 Tax=uncultured Roseobacter sp. TaxID=114847 RepID=UPI002616E7A3|nr:hypothetical protein [uncultured Roseobacter sp.]